MNYDRDRLIKLLRMLGSPNDNERNVAASKIANMVAEAGLDWDKLLAAAHAPPPTQQVKGAAQQAYEQRTRRAYSRAFGPDPFDDPPKPKPKTVDWRSMARQLNYLQSKLSDWEKQFVSGLVRQNHATQKQVGVLMKIYRERMSEVG